MNYKKPKFPYVMTITPENALITIANGGGLFGPVHRVSDALGIAAIDALCAQYDDWYWYRGSGMRLGYDVVVEDGNFVVTIRS